ncbi:20074_t:CDS:2 [Rhizophagus irregularis]|nr:20074_t:CDS:2 [Rhizophagus irregularis]
MKILFDKTKTTPNLFQFKTEALVNYFLHFIPSKGKFSVDNNENNEISFVDILIASDKLGFLEIYQHLEKRLLEHESAWKIPKDFITIFQFREDDRFAGLYEVAIGLVLIPKLSQVKSKKEAIIWCKNKGPCFGLQDLWINRNLRSGKSKQKSYENKIIDSKTFDIEEFEVFQIIDNRFSTLKLFKKACNFTGRIIKGTFQLTRRTIQSIIRFISNIERETYEKLFIGLSILGALALLAFIIYKFIMASFLTKILVVVIIAAITAIIIYICNKLDL